MTTASPLPFHRKVLGVGLGRTGTASLAAAPDRLGIPTTHHVVLGPDLDPICSILGMVAPGTAFPRRNTRVELDQWAERSESFWRQVDGIVASEEAFLLVDDGRLPTGGWSVRRFGKLNGQYQGKPGSEASMVAELDRLPDDRIRRVIFAWDAFWWLEEYPVLRERLEEKGTVEARTPELLCFLLRRADSKEREP